MHDLVPLQLLPCGSFGWIEQLMGRAEEVHRLEELGIRKGSRVEMVQSGSPCIVKLDGGKFCFRDADVAHVLVRLGEAA